MSEDLAPPVVAPPVVAVVVSHDPGPWLEACLESLAAQDYPSLSVLVIDAASTPELAPRVARVAPDFFLRRLEDNRGFGPNANAVRGVVDGAAHFVFCHDDVVLASDAIRRMVEEAFRQNAGVAGPKFVDPHEPDRILQFGLGVDRFGAPVRRVERREFDQAQHDEVQEVFAVPGGCTLVRADLFDAIDGFDPEISMFGEDVDLCWRARLAGARVFAFPQVVVSHLEATSARHRELRESRALQWRHELRVVMKNYGVLRRLVVLTQLALLSVAEITYFVALGRPSRARQVRDAWIWNLQKERGLKAARAAVAATRRISDHEIAGLFTRRTFRVWRFVQPHLEEVLLAWSMSGRSSARVELERLRHRNRRPRFVTALGVLVVLVMLFGSRSLLFGHLPLTGDLLPLPSPWNLLGHYFGGVRSDGTGTVVPASPALLLLGVAGLVAIGGMGVVIKVTIICSVVFGALGVARLLRPSCGPVARLAGATVYLFLPLWENDLARGDLLALVAYGGAPYVLRRVLRATAVTPYADQVTAGTRRDVAREVLGFSLLLAFLGCFVPLVAISAPIVAAGVAIGCAAVGSWRAGLRAFLVTCTSVAGAFILTLPWSVSLVDRGTSWAAVLGAPPDASLSPQLGAVLRLELGPFGAGLLGLALIASGLFVLAVADGARFRLAVAVWTTTLGVAAFIWAATEGWLGGTGGALRVLAAPLAVAIAVAVALGVSVLAEEIVNSGFGWRHLLAGGFAVLVGLGLLPALGATASGRFDLPETGYDAVLSWIGPGAAPNTQSVLWLGDPVALPAPSFAIRPGLAAGFSSPGLPDGISLFPGINASALHGVATATLAAESGTTVRLGATFARDGIRYVVVPTDSAPSLQAGSAGAVAPPPELLLDALTAQSDLHELPSVAGMLLFEDTAWHKGGDVTVTGGVPPWLRSVGMAAQFALLVGLVGAWTVMHRRRRSARHARHGPPELNSMLDGVDEEELAGSGAMPQ